MQQRPTVVDQPTALEPYGWNEHLTGRFQRFAAQGMFPGRVLRVDRGECTIATDGGADMMGADGSQSDRPPGRVCTRPCIVTQPVMRCRSQTGILSIACVKRDQGMFGLISKMTAVPGRRDELAQILTRISVGMPG